MQRKTEKLKSFKNMTISSKITLIYSGFFSLIFIVLSAFLVFNTNVVYNKISEKELNETLNKVEEYIKSGNEITQEKINELNPNKYVEIAVVKHNISKTPPEISQVPPDTPNNSETNFTPPELKQPPFDQNRPGKIHSEILKGKKYYYFNRNVVVGNTEYTIQVFRPYNHEQHIINLFITLFLIINAVGVLISYLIGKFISKRILKPVINITNTAKSITINDLSKRIEIPAADDEIRTLAVTFNEMIERLNVSVEKQKRFVSNASHELRTPIAVIQGYANLIDRWGKNDAAVLNEAITSIKSETEQMNSLINGLLLLAREDNGKSIPTEKINISEIIEDVHREAEISFSNIKFTFETEKNIYINGNDTLMKQLLWIFTENAAKYNRSPFPFVNVRLYSENNLAHILIEDNGQGISKEDIPYIFDRFYRGDKSRNKEIPGTGLGLSVAYAIIKKHNGTVETKSIIDKGTCFILSFPIIN